MTDRKTPGQSPSEQQQSPTAQYTPDTIGIGRTAGQRTAEIIAGIRSELAPSLLHDALTSRGGKIAARLMKTIIPDDKLNFAIGRNDAFKRLVENAMHAQGGTLFVDLAAGLSPRSFDLAREHPEWTIIEIDLPDVVQEKRRRLNRQFELDDYPNLQWIGADLGAVSLLDLLGDKRPDVISAEGLLPYLTYEQIKNLLDHSYQALQPGGTVLMDVGAKAGQSEIAKAMSTFLRYANFRDDANNARWQTEEEAIALFAEANFQQIQAHRLPDLADEYDLLKPQPHIEYFVEAKKAPASDQPAEPTEPTEPTEPNEAKADDTAVSTEAAITPADDDKLPAPDNAAATDTEPVHDTAASTDAEIVPTDEEKLPAPDDTDDEPTPTKDD